MTILGMEIIKLRQVSKPIQDTRPVKLEKILRKLTANSAGLQIDFYGLAAPQIGEFVRAFILRSGPLTKLFVNPEVLETSEELTEEVEYCLSFPVLGVKIKRPKTVKIRYVDSLGVLREDEYTGIVARTILHEIDHLDGRLIIDYLAYEPENEMAPGEPVESLPELGSGGETGPESIHSELS